MVVGSRDQIIKKDSEIVDLGAICTDRQSDYSFQITVTLSILDPCPGDAPSL